MLNFCFGERSDIDKCDNVGGLSSGSCEKFRQFMQWRFWVGVVLGFLTGPVYLLIHVFEGIRKSSKWEVIAEGSTLDLDFLHWLFIF